MKNKLSILIGSISLLAFSAVAYAQAPSDDLSQLVKGAVEAAKGGQWSALASLVIMVLVFLATKVPFIHSRLPNAAKPWVAAIAGVLAAVAATAMTTGDWAAAIMNGFLTGAAASGFWELAGKKFLK